MKFLPAQTQVDQSAVDDKSLAGSEKIFLGDFHPDYTTRKSKKKVVLKILQRKVHTANNTVREFDNKDSHPMHNSIISKA